MVAAKTMALTVIDLMTNPTHLERARAEFDKSRGPDFKYTTRLADRKPALDYRKNP
jgi:aminobenzoyl-glutamate utilization protein B